jgi:hypothetical protein
MISGPHLGAAAIVASNAMDEWQKTRAKCASGYLAAASTLELRLP